MFPGRDLTSNNNLTDSASIALPSFLCPFGVQDFSINQEEEREREGSVMRIIEVFTMGGVYGRGHVTGCESRIGHYKGCIPFDDPRYTRREGAHIVGSRHDGSGLLGLLRTLHVT
jgi:hypothetical protein